MRQNPTKDDTPKELTPQQFAAADMLATGRTVTETAESVGVARQTVSGWLNQSREFRAEFGQRRGEIWEVSGARLRALLPKALDALEQSLQAGSVAAATAVLRAAGLHALGAPTDPRTVEDVEIAEKQERADRQLRGAFLPY